MLTSPQNTRVKLVRQLLRQREAREQEHLFVAEGMRLVNDFLQSGLHARFAFTTDESTATQWEREYPTVECFRISDDIMHQVSLEKTPPGILVVFEIPEPGGTIVSYEWHLPILILDTMRDPGNLGACLRVAAGADCRLVLLTPGCVDAYNPKVVRGGMGAHARVAVANAEWDEVRSICHARTIYAAESSGVQRYDQVHWVEPCALVIGGEASGISTPARALVTNTVRIPLANHVESLNAAVACGVILFEAMRQRDRFHTGDSSS